MKILLLTQVVPFPPDSGPKIKTYNVLRYLARRHDIHLVSFARSAAEADQAQALRSYCKSVTTVPLRRSRFRDLGYLIRSLITDRPFLIERDDVSEMRTTVDHLLASQKFDAIHADQISMAQFGVDAPVRLRVLDEHNAVWTIVRRSAQRDHGLQRIAAELEWRKMRAFEGQVCPRFDYTTVVSEHDRHFLENAAGGPFRSVVIPIAVDTHELHLIPRREARHVLSVATMFYPPNVEAAHWFASQSYPLVRAAVPDTQFFIVGSRPPARITCLAKPGSGIVVTGYVADLDPILRQSAVLVVPVHSGSGMRVKILEAFARGVPVVTTKVGVEGIEAVPGEHLLVADSPHEFAQAVIRVLRDRAEAERLARAARQLVEARYDWRVALRGLDDVYSVMDSQQIMPRSRIPSLRA